MNDGLLAGCNGAGTATTDAHRTPSEGPDRISADHSELRAVHNVAWSARMCRPCSEPGPSDFIPTVSRAVHEREWTSEGEGLQCRGVPRD